MQTNGRILYFCAVYEDGYGDKYQGPPMNWEQVRLLVDNHEQIEFERGALADLRVRIQVYRAKQMARAVLEPMCQKSGS